MTDKRIVFSTTSSEEEARRIAWHLVEHKLAACVNILPHVESIYRWQDKVESAREWLLLIKTTAEGFVAVRDAILELHAYDVPECVAIAVDDGSLEYLEWVADSVSVGEE